MLKNTTFASSSEGNMYLLESKKAKILIECGLEKIAIRKKLMGAKSLLITDLDCCLVTHAHQDHCKNIEYIAEYIDVYSNIEVADKYENVKYIEESVIIG